MNDYEIDSARNWFSPADHPRLHDAVEGLNRFVGWVNNNSDGWAYWKAPQKAADRLIAKLQEKREAISRTHYSSEWVEDLTKEEWASLWRPIRRLMGDQKVDDPDAVLFPPRLQPGRRTVLAQVSVTFDVGTSKFDERDLADAIRDMVFTTIREETDLDPVVMEVVGLRTVDTVLISDKEA